MSDDRDPDDSLSPGGQRPTNRSSGHYSLEFRPMGNAVLANL